MGTEKRQHPRFAAEAEVEIVVDEQIIARGRTVNLSAGGFCAQVQGVVARGATVGASLKLVFSADSFSEALLLPARVAWSTPMDDGVQLGCSFVRLTPEQRQYLDMFLRYLDPAS